MSPSWTLNSHLRGPSILTVVELLTCRELQNLVRTCRQAASSPDLVFIVVNPESQRQRRLLKVRHLSLYEGPCSLDAFHLSSLVVLRLRMTGDEVANASSSIAGAADQLNQLQQLSLKMSDQTSRAPRYDSWVLKLVKSLAHNAVPLRRLSLPGISLLRPTCRKLGVELSRCTCLQLIGLPDVSITDNGWSDLVLGLRGRVDVTIAGSWTVQQRSTINTLLAGIVGPVLSNPGELQEAGFRPRELLEAGFDLAPHELRGVGLGYLYPELQQFGFEAKQMQAEDFDARQDASRGRVHDLRGLAPVTMRSPGWDRQEWMRAAGVAAVKRSTDYLGATWGPRPKTPDPTDQKLSNDAWKCKVRQWRMGLKRIRERRAGMQGPA